MCLLFAIFKHYTRYVTLRPGFFLNLKLLYIVEVDESANWWANVVSVAVYWLMGDDENAERCYSLIDSFPKKLHSTE